MERAICFIGSMRDRMQLLTPPEIEVLRLSPPSKLRRLLTDRRMAAQLVIESYSTARHRLPAIDCRPLLDLVQPELRLNCCLGKIEDYAFLTIYVLSFYDQDSDVAERGIRMLDTFVESVRC
jgi:hypothetical protein